MPQVFEGVEATPLKDAGAKRRQSDNVTINQVAKRRQYWVTNKKGHPTG